MRRVPLRWGVAGAVGAALGSGGVAWADSSSTPGIRIDQLQPASPESPFFRAEGPHAPAGEALEFAVGATFDYAHDLLKESVALGSGASQVTTLVRNAALARLGASLTPIHWLTVDAELPIALWETGSSATTTPGGIGAPRGEAPAVGDLRLGVHFRPIDAQLFGLLIGGRVWAPFGAQASYLSDGRARAEIDLGAAGEKEKALYGCTFNVAPGFFGHRAGDRVAGSCAGYFSPTSWFAAGIEPSFEVLTEPTIPLAGAPAGNTISAIFEPLLGVRFRKGGVRLGVAGGPVVGGAPGSGDGRVLVSLAYVGSGRPPAPPSGPPDRDGDGIPDDGDACPNEAGPPASPGRAAGCPVRDRDGDGVPDAVDACPDQPGVEHSDPKVNGCPDSDNDGLPDSIDACPREPGRPPTGCPKRTHLGDRGFAIDPPIDFGPFERLRPSDRVALEELAATLRANPKLGPVIIVLGTKGGLRAHAEPRTREILAILSAAKLDASRYEIVLHDDVRGGLVEIRSSR